MARAKNSNTIQYTVQAQAISKRRNGGIKNRRFFTSKNISKTRAKNGNTIQYTVQGKQHKQTHQTNGKPYIADCQRFNGVLPLTAQRRKQNRQPSGRLIRERLKSPCRAFWCTKWQINRYKRSF
jgi:excinuclease UvrABC ATPase subunit